jgi:hypothetical protein
MVTDATNGQMEEHILEVGEIIKWTDTANTRFLAVNITRASTKMT